MIAVLLGGFLGGALRGFTGIAKTLVTKKDEQINIKYLILSISVSAVVGITASLMFPLDFKYALLAGYAGSDFLEALFKLKLKAKLEKSVQKPAGTAKPFGIS